MTRLLALTLMGALVFPAYAATHCDTREYLIQHLGSKYHERRIGAGISGGGQLIELLSSPDGATWTIIATLPNGCSHMIVTGEHWTSIVIEKGKGA